MHSNEPSQEFAAVAWVGAVYAAANEMQVNGEHSQQGLISVDRIGKVYDVITHHLIDRAGTGVVRYGIWRRSRSI